MRFSWAARLSQAGLLEDGALSRHRQVLLGMRHRDLAKLGGVLELMMGTHGMNQVPAIGFQLLEEVCAVHPCNHEFYTTIHNGVVRIFVTRIARRPWPCGVRLGVATGSALDVAGDDDRVTVADSPAPGCPISQARSSPINLAGMVRRSRSSDRGN